MERSSNCTFLGSRTLHPPIPRASDNVGTRSAAGTPLRTVPKRTERWTQTSARRVEVPTRAELVDSECLGMRVGFLYLLLVFRIGKRVQIYKMAGVYLEP